MYILWGHGSKQTSNLTIYFLDVLANRKQFSLGRISVKHQY